MSAIRDLNFSSQENFSFSRRNRSGILQQVDENLLQGIPIGMNMRHRVGQVYAQADFLFAQLLAGIGDGFVDCMAEIHSFWIKFILLSIEYRYPRKIIQQNRHALR